MEVHACLPLKRLAKGIAVKAEVLDSSQWEEILTSIFFCPVPAPMKTLPWDIYKIPFSKGSAWGQRDRSFWHRSRVYISDVQVMPLLLRWHCHHPHRCFHLDLLLHYPTRRHWDISPGWGRALSVVPWNVGAWPLSKLHSLCIPFASTVVELGMWKDYIPVCFLWCLFMNLLYRGMPDSFVNLLMLSVSITYSSCKFQKWSKPPKSPWSPGC